MDPAAARGLAIVVSAAAGLAVGSFLNVVIYRLPRGESLLRPASRCPACQAPLGAIENVPLVSWVVLRARCRHCTAPISIRYPLVELLGAALFAGLAAAVPTLAPLAPLDVVAGATVAIGAIALDGCQPPAVLGWVAAAGSAALVPVALAAGSPGRLAWAAISGGTAMAAGQIPKRGAGRNELHRARTPVTCAAWGWSAGWCALGGGLSVAAALLLVSAVPSGRSDRSRAAIVGSVALACVLVGCALVGRRAG